MSKLKVVFVVGPTASGKSALALKWAQEFSGAIINCDSIQLFKSVDIGSAKPSAEEFQKVPHFLFDYVPPGQEMTAGEYRRDFFALLEKIEKKFPIVFVVGGTGFYFQAIEKGMYSIGKADQQTQEKVEAELEVLGGPERLHEELKKADPESAAKISINDHYRLGRAIEVIRYHGMPISEVKKKFENEVEPFPFPLLKLGIKASRQELEPGVLLRTKNMLAAGLIKEVEGLLEQNLENWAPLSSVGYLETVQFLKLKKASKNWPEIEKNELKNLQDLIVQNTLRLAKKQRTWFQRDQQIQWLKMNDEATGRNIISEWLTGEK